MIDVVFSPKWFNGVDIIFEFISVIVLVLIASYSLKLYKFNGEKHFRDFAIAFFIIGAAFVFKILTNITVYYNVLETFSVGLLSFTVSSYKASSIFYNGGYFLYRLLTLIGLYTIVTIIDKKETNSLFMIYFIIATTLFSTWAYYIFHTTTFLFGAYIAWIYFNNYRKRVIACELCDKKAKNIKFLFISFGIIALSNILFTFIRYTEYAYVAAEYIQLLGYVILLYSFVRVIKYGKKAK